jgi:hypothetical protein
MPSLRSLAALSVLGGSAFLFACGDDSSSSSSQGGGGTGASGSGGAGGSYEVPEGCTEIFATGPTIFNSVATAVIEVTPAKAGPAPEVVVVAPEFMGPTRRGTHEFLGFESEVLGLAVEDAIIELIDRPANAQDGRIFVATEGVVRIDASPDYGTIFMGRIAGELRNVVYRELDVNNDVINGGECWFLRSASFDNSAYAPDCDTPQLPSAPPSGGACLADYLAGGHSCNPVSGEGCESGEVCDLGGVQFQCYPGTDATEDLCAACSNIDGGPYCKSGMTCDGNNDTGVCHRYCCTDADCGAAGSCVSYYALGVGICLQN